MPCVSPSSGKRLKQGPNQIVKDFVREVNATYTETYGNSQSEYDGKSVEAINLRQFRRETKKEWLIAGIHQAIRDALPYDIDDINSWRDVVDVVEDSESLVMLHRIKKKTYAGFISRRFTRVYVDGTCLRNGQQDPRGGIGIWFGHEHPWYVSYCSIISVLAIGDSFKIFLLSLYRNFRAPLHSSDKQTNNVAELRAAIEAIEIAKENGK